MARVYTIQKARASKHKRFCCNCRQEVQVGERYRYADLKTGTYTSTTRIWCFRCQPKQSQLTVNDRMVQLYTAQEDLQDFLKQFNNGDIEVSDLESAFNDVADSIEEVADSYEESIENMPENLQYSAQADEMREKADSVREWAELLRNIDWPEQETDCAECEEEENAACHQEGEDEYDHDFEKKTPDISEAEAAADEFPL